MRKPVFVVVLLVVVLVIALGLVLAGARVGAFTGGGARPRQNVVVDTLNLTHWLAKKQRPLDTQQIIDTIAATAPRIKAAYPERVTYVTKDRESVLNDPETRAAYAAASKEHGVHIAVVERYEEPPGPKTKTGKRSRPLERNQHASRGRDDFYLGLLAKAYRCPVLTEDRFRDFDQLRHAVAPFHVDTYTHWQARPTRDYINPAAREYARLRKPQAVRFASILT